AGEEALRDRLGDEAFDGVGGALDERAGVVVRLEVREDVVRERARVAALGPTDADAQAREVLRLQMLRDRAQPIVTREPAAALHLDAAEVEVALVVHDEHVLRLDLEERGRRADRTARVVHVRLRLQEDELLVADLDLRELPGELRLPRAAVPAR